MTQIQSRRVCIPEDIREVQHALWGIANDLHEIDGVSSAYTYALRHLSRELDYCATAIENANGLQKA